MKTVLPLALWMACAPFDVVEVDTTGGPTPPAPEPTRTPDCEETPVHVVDLRADEIDGQLFGRRVQVELDREAGAIVTCELTQAPPSWKQLLALRSDWRFSITDPGSGWTDAAYDDGAWSEGPGPFTFNQEGQTDIAPGASLPPDVVYFRRTFEVDDPTAIEQIRVAARRDDGVVVYVNGIEIHRDNVPVKLPMYGNDEINLQGGAATLPSGLLVAGQNTIAVELHQFEGSGDASFDLRLTAAIANDPGGEVHLLESPEPASRHEMMLYGLLGDATYTCRARSTSCAGQIAEVEIQTPPVPAMVPNSAPHPTQDTPAWGAYTLFNHQRPCADDLRNRLVILDPEGRVRWNYEMPLEGNSTIDIESVLIGPDEILWAGGQQPEGSPQIVGLDGQVRYFTEYPGSEHDVYHHDVILQPDGRILAIAESNVRGQTHTWTGYALIEHDPATNQETWKWRTEEAFQRGELPPAEIGDYDPYHANAFAAVSDELGEGVYVGQLYTDDIVRIDRATGEILFTVGEGKDFQLVDASGAPLPDAKWFDAHHGLNLYGDLLYLFDNGWRAQQSRGMALRLDFQARTAELVWEWTEFGWFDKHWGDVDELPGGSVLIGMSNPWCHDGGRGHPGGLVEIDPVSNQPVWRVDFLDVSDSTYRSQRLHGCEIFANSRYCPNVAERIAQLER